MAVGHTSALRRRSPRVAGVLRLSRRCICARRRRRACSPLARALLGSSSRRRSLPPLPDGRFVGSRALHLMRTEMISPDRPQSANRQQKPTTNTCAGSAIVRGRSLSGSRVLASLGRPPAATPLIRAPAPFQLPLAARRWAVGASLRRSSWLRPLVPSVPPAACRALRGRASPVRSLRLLLRAPSCSRRLSALVSPSPSARAILSPMAFLALGRASGRLSAPRSRRSCGSSMPRCGRCACPPDGGCGRPLAGRCIRSWPVPTEKPLSIQS